MSGMYQRKAKRNAGEYGRVGVLYGGNSGERAVSLKSGQRVHEALQAQGVDSVLIDAANDVVNAFAVYDVSRVFNALHGQGGGRWSHAGAVGYHRSAVYRQWCHGFFAYYEQNPDQADMDGSGSANR